MTKASISPSRIKRGALGRAKGFGFSRQLQNHLDLHQADLPAGGEWTVEEPGWCLVGLTSGLGYCIGGPNAIELAPGDLVVVPPSSPVVFRASQLGGAKLHYFAFRPQVLTGLLTLGERRHFADLAACSAPELLRFPPSHPAASEFAALRENPVEENLFLNRCRLLVLAATVFPPAPQTAPGSSLGPRPAPARFLELIQTMPESEILHHSPAGLAALCRCSTRHFNRLFRTHFGLSFRAKQTRFRLEKASQLLRETDSKIVDLALESGYRHLGLFNAMFKKHFGVTPSQLRRADAKPPRAKASRLVSILLLLFLAVSVIFKSSAADPPKPRPGSPPAQPLAPPAPAKSTNAPVFAIKGYDVQGNTVLPVPVLTKIFGSHLGSHATFDTIRQALGELQLAYRARGYVTVSVALPRQQITNGIVKVKVTEGRLAGIKVVNARHFSSNNVMRTLPSLRTNILLNNLALQQELDRANQSRDRQIYPELGPGPDPGTTSLLLKVKDQLPLHERVELNNYSTPTTPQLRVNTSVDYDNLWQLDQQVGAQYAFSPQDFKSKADDAPFYDLPSVDSYSAFYRIPLAGLGPAPERSVNSSDFGYDEVTKRFRPPPLEGGPELLFYASRSDSDAGDLLASDTILNTSVTNSGSPSSFTAETKVFNETVLVNEDLGARFSDPLPRFWGISSTLSAGLDFKVFQSSTTQTSETIASIAGQTLATAEEPRTVSAYVNYIPLAVAWNAQRPDPSGSLSFNLNNSFNIASLLGNENDFRQAAGSAQSDGNYFVSDAGLSREQKLLAGWWLRVSADGQWANEPLLNTERFALGGNAGVRGYRDGEEYGDTGWRLMFEPHTQTTKVGLVAGKLPVYARFSVFTDYGRVYYLDPAAGSPSQISLWGVGCGASGTIGEHVDYRLAYGAPLLDAADVKRGQGRISFMVGLQF